MGLGTTNAICIAKTIGSIHYRVIKMIKNCGDNTSFLKKKSNKYCSKGSRLKVEYYFFLNNNVYEPI